MSETITVDVEVLRAVVSEAIADYFDNATIDPIVEEAESPWGTEFNSVGGRTYRPLQEWKNANPKFQQYFYLIPDYWIAVVENYDVPLADLDTLDQLRRNKQNFHNNRFGRLNDDANDDGVPDSFYTLTRSRPAPLGSGYPVMTAMKFNPRFSGDTQKETRVGTIGMHENPRFRGEKYGETTYGTPDWTVMVKYESSIIPVVEAYCNALRNEDVQEWWQ